MPEAPQWARVRGEMNCYIRRGAWYEVLRLTPEEVVLEVNRQPVRVERSALQIVPPAAKLVRGGPPPGLGRHANGLGLALRGLPRLLPSPGTAGTATRVAVRELRGRVRDRLG